MTPVENTGSLPAPLGAGDLIDRAVEQRSVDETLSKCGDIIRGEPTRKGELVELVAARELDDELGVSLSVRQRSK